MNFVQQNEIFRHKIRRIQCKKHKMGTYKISKISVFDDKRFVMQLLFS